MNIAPFNTYLEVCPGMSTAELDQAVAGLVRRQKAIDACVHGEMDADDLYELLADDGIDPNEWADTSADNLEFVMGIV